MEASELRIGNLVDLYGSVATVTRHDFSETPPKVLAVDSGKPIELTEEWLIKSGCEKSLENTFIIDRFELTWQCKYKFWYVKDLESFAYLTKVEFVHEWQNFYYVMQGQELKIK